jgi:hypothetical protein
MLEAPGDPLGTLQGAGDATHLLVARVRSSPEEYTHGRQHKVPCQVVDYEGDEVQGSTWARLSDGMVLAQEITVGKTRWGVYRD